MKTQHVIAMALFAVLAAIFAACGGGGTDQVEPGQKAPGPDCKTKPEQCK